MNMQPRKGFEGRHQTLNPEKDSGQALNAQWGKADMAGGGTRRDTWTTGIVPYNSEGTRATLPPPILPNEAICNVEENTSI